MEAALGRDRAFVLLVVDAALVTFAAIAVLWWFGYRPADWTDRPLRERLSPEFSTPLVLHAALLVLLTVFGVVIAGEVAFEDEYLEKDWHRWWLTTI